MSGRRFLLARLVFVSLVAAIACGGSATSPSGAKTAAATGPACDAALWTHVYDPSRLKVMSACVTLTGTVDNAPHVSDDGDETFHVVPDAPFLNLLNSASNGHLHVEAICQGTIQSDTPQASQSCGSFKGTLTIPPPGTHVTVTGSYVLDGNHGWMEIHPLTSIVRIP